MTNKKTFITKLNGEKIEIKDYKKTVLQTKTAINFYDWHLKLIREGHSIAYSEDGHKNWLHIQMELIKLGNEIGINYFSVE